MIKAPMRCKKITKILFHQYKKYEELVAYLENFAKTFIKIIITYKKIFVGLYYAKPINSFKCLNANYLKSNKETFF